MNKKVNTHLKDFLKSPDSGVSKERSRYLALISMTVYKYMDYMMEEIERAGFKGLEFLEKCELFLKCVTSGYSKKSFDQLMHVFESTDKNFKQTKFYTGLKSLRALCTGDGIENIEIMKGLDSFETVSTKDLSGDVVFFTTYLIENIQKNLRHMRAEKASKTLKIDDFKYMIGEEFDHCVVGTVLSIGHGPAYAS